MKEILTHSDINSREGFSVISRMNYRPAGNIHSVFLTFTDDDDLFADEFQGDRCYFRGSNMRRSEADSPETADQSLYRRSGKKSANGIFFDIATAYRESGGSVNPEIIRVYKKLKPNVWQFEGEFELVDAKFGNYPKANRKIFVFTLKRRRPVL